MRVFARKGRARRRVRARDSRATAVTGLGFGLAGLRLASRVPACKRDGAASRLLVRVGVGGPPLVVPPSVRGNESARGTAETHCHRLPTPAVAISK